MIDQAELVAAAEGALNAANTYAMESGKEWSTAAWRIQLVKLQTNLNIAAGLARTIHTMPEGNQAQAISTIRQAAKDAAVLLAGAPPSGSSAEASALADLRLKLIEMQKVAQEGSNKSGVSKTVVFVALAAAGGVAALLLSRRT